MIYIRFLLSLRIVEDQVRERDPNLTLSVEGSSHPRDLFHSCQLFLPWLIRNQRCGEASGGRTGRR